MADSSARDIMWLAACGDYSIAHTRMGTLAVFGWRPRALTQDEQETSALDAEAFLAREAGKYKALAVAMVLVSLGTLSMIIIGAAAELILNGLDDFPPSWSQVVDALPWVPLAIYIVWGLICAPSALSDSLRGTRNIHELVSTVLRTGHDDVMRMLAFANTRGLARVQALFEHNSRLRKVVDAPA